MTQQLHEVTQVAPSLIQEAAFEVPVTPIHMLDTELIRSERIETEDSNRLHEADSDLHKFEAHFDQIRSDFATLRYAVAEKLTEHAVSTDELQHLRNKYDGLTRTLASTEQGIATTRTAIGERQQAIRLLKEDDEALQERIAADEEYLNRTPQTDEERLEMMTFAYQVVEQPVAPPKTDDGRFRTAENLMETKYRDELADLESQLTRLLDAENTLHFNIDRARSDIEKQITVHYRLETEKNELSAELAEFIKTKLHSLERRINFKEKLRELGGAAIFEEPETTETGGGSHAE